MNYTFYCSCLTLKLVPKVHLLDTGLYCGIQPCENQLYLYTAHCRKLPKDQRVFLSYDFYNVIILLIYQDMIYDF